MPPSAQQPDLATLRAIVDAVRRGPPPAGRATQVAPAPLIALLALLLAGFLHARAFHAWTPRPASIAPAEEFPVKTVREMAVVSSFALASACLAQDAVQWRVEDGGNGHWYARTQTATTATVAFASAAALGGDLASISGGNENAFVRGVSNSASHWIGGVQAPGSCEPGCGWSWSDGTPWTYSNWGFGEPNDGISTPGESSIELMSDGRWNDFWPWQTLPAIIEWSADCNSDGIVDYGQIRAGELADANGNNIPDCCENGTACDCVGDIDRSGAVNGVDLSIILNAWGVGGGKYPEADVNGDGTVDAVDLSFVLNAWGPCS